MKFGEAMKLRRMKQGIGQIELADRVGTTQANISKIERGEHFPEVRTAFRIAKELGISAADLERLVRNN